ncbi:MAG: NYN domain-containing protein [Anaerolineae bacterium]
MKYLIDGHNLIARLPDLSLADPDDEIELIRLLARWRWRHKSPPVTVVFDPGDVAVYGGHRTQQSGIAVQYAPFGSDADAVLIRLIRARRQPAQLAVVTSDREIQAAARQAGARTISAEEFAGELTPPAAAQDDIPRDKPLSPDEVKAWLDIFQGNDGVSDQ